MKEINISALKDSDLKFSELMSELKRNYHRSWNDDVHESFVKYIDQVEQYAADLHRIRCTMETTVDEVENLKFDAMILDAERICKEVEEFD